MSRDRLVDTFVELARIASPTFDEAAVAERVAEMLRDTGCEVRFDDTAERTGSNTGNIIAVLPATGPGKTIVLSAHLDTVEPAEGIEPVIEDGVIRSRGKTILGADDKVGVATIIEVVRWASEHDAPHPEIRCVLTVAEEKGLVGAKALDPADVGGDLCLVLDADGRPGGIVVGSPTHYTFKATFTGRGAHAGVQPEKGISALRMAAQAALDMPHGRIDDETTANIGSIRGGTATNVVPDRIDLTGECRSRDPQKVERIRSKMQSAMDGAAREAEGRVTVRWIKEYEAVRFDDDDPLLELVESACRDVGIEPHHFRTGGGSDGNVLFAKGVPALVLASGIRDFHTVDESILVEDLVALAEIVKAVVARAGA